MNGAEAMIRTLVDSGVDVCFTNPGTSEMHFVAALDTVPEMRAVLGLFEGVATGAADGYGRMADRAAATLVHLGPGMGNGLANLHNARRARTPVVNIVGDHATYHLEFDAPLTSDIEAVARNVSSWIRRPETANELGDATADAVRAALGPPGQVATLILPADASWSEGGAPVGPRPRASRVPVDPEVVEQVAKALVSGEQTTLLVGGSALRERGLRAAARIATATGAKLLAETFPARLERGAGVPGIERLGYLSEFMELQLAGTRHLIVVDTGLPVGFFAYPGKASYLVPDGCDVHVVADPAAGLDAVGALEHLAGVVAAGVDPPTEPARRPDRPTGPLTGETVAAAVGALLPEGAIVCDEANTSGLWAAGATAGAPRHDWLTLTGGAIGIGMPLATGAAVACPDRKVINLEADGSAMYTVQALWTQSREALDVTTIVFNNRSYAVLNMELARTGAGAGGPKARSLFDLSDPDIDFVSIARGMGVPAERCDSAESFTTALERAISEEGPSLVEAVIPPPF